MREAGVSLRHARRLLLVVARAGQGRVRLRLARRRHGPAPRRTTSPSTWPPPPPPPPRGSPPPTRRSLPVDRDGHTLWPGSRQAWCPSSRGLPRPRPRPHHPARPALPRPPGAGPVARLERVRLPQRPLLLRHLRGRLPRSGCAQRYDDARPPQRRVGHRLLEPALHRLGAGPAPAAHDDVRQPHPRARLPRASSPTPLLDFYRAEKAVLTDLSPGVPVTTNFMTLAHFDHLDYHQWAPEQDVVSTDHYVVDVLEHPRAELAFSGDLTRGLAGGRALAAHGALDQRGQLAAGQPGQGPGRDRARQPRPRRPGRRHHRLLPVAPVPRRVREVPLRAGARTPARDSARFREVCRARRHRRPARARSSGSRVEADVAILWDYQAASGPRRARRCRPAQLDYPHRRRTRSTACCATAASRPTSCTPAADLDGIPGRRRPHPLSRDRRPRRGRRRRGRAPARRSSSPSSPASATEHDHVRLGGYPGAFRDAARRAGRRSSSPCGSARPSPWASGGAGSAVERGRSPPVDAEVLDRYAAGPLAGPPRRHPRATAGDGAAWYLGTLPDDAALGGVARPRPVRARRRRRPRPPCRPASRPSGGAAPPAPGCSCSTTPTSRRRWRPPATTWWRGPGRGQRARSGRRGSPSSGRADQCSPANAAPHPDDRQPSSARCASPTSSSSSASPT